MGVSYDHWLSSANEAHEELEHAVDLAENELWEGLGDLTVSIQTVHEALVGRAAQRAFAEVVRGIAEALVDADCP